MHGANMNNFNILLRIFWYHYCVYSTNVRIADRINL